MRLLTITASDSAGCAGIAADLRTFAALDAHGCCALTALTAQDTSAVLHVEPVDASLVALQIQAVAGDISLDGVKVGLLPTPKIVRAVATEIRRLSPGPIVVDPVLASSGGFELASGDTAAVLVGALAPLATVITPNLAELQRLTGLPVSTASEVDAAARRLVEVAGCAVIATGGHGGDADRVADIVYDGGSRTAVEGPRVASTHSRGTGCVYSSALAVGLARGLELTDAARLAQSVVRRGLERGYPLGRAARPVTAP